jgi:hypothetical protein
MFETNLPSLSKICCPLFTNNLTQAQFKAVYINSSFKRLGKAFMEYRIKCCKCSIGTSSLLSMVFEVGFNTVQFDALDSDLRISINLRSIGYGGIYKSTLTPFLITRATRSGLRMKMLSTTK